MSHDFCPICHTALEVRDVAPCMECGAVTIEIEHALAGKHTYAQYRIFDDLTLVLCNICWLEFGNFNPEYFGLPKDTLLGPSRIDFVRSVDDVQIGEDKYCPNCHARLAFLKFVAEARAVHAGSELQ